MKAAAVDRGTTYCAASNVSNGFTAVRSAAGNAARNAAGTFSKAASQLNNRVKNSGRLQKAGFNSLHIMCLFFASLIMMLSVFLPFVSASAYGYSESVSFIGSISGGMGPGILFLILGGLSLLFAALKMEKTGIVFGFITGILGLLVSMASMSNIKSYLGSYAHAGIGYVLIVFASVALIAGAVLTIIARTKRNNA